MQITRLAKSSSGSRINVYIDQKYAFSVVVDTLVREGLFVGKQIEKADVARIKTEDLERRMYEKAISAILSRPRSELEIRQKLNEWLARYKVEKIEAEKYRENVVVKL